MLSALRDVKKSLSHSLVYAFMSPRVGEGWADLTAFIILSSTSVMPITYLLEHTFDRVDNSK